MPADHAPRYVWNNWSRAADAVAIGLLSAALTVASHGRWFHWLLLNLSLGWLFGRFQRPRPTT